MGNRREDNQCGDCERPIPSYEDLCFDCIREREYDTLGLAEMDAMQSDRG